MFSLNPKAYTQGPCYFTVLTTANEFLEGVTNFWRGWVLHFLYLFINYVCALF